MPVEGVADVVNKDSLFYRNSNGGVTLSGGDPCFQPDFARGVLRLCRGSGLHTAIETCGYAHPSALESLLEHTDLVLFDLKHMDSDVHRKVTGVGNELILSNARLVSLRGVKMTIRVPVIPGINDSRENIICTARFVLELDAVAQVDLVPYHRFGVPKYASLDRQYELDALTSPSAEKMAELQDTMVLCGLDCGIGG